MTSFIKKWGGSIFLLPVMIYFASTRGDFHFIDFVNLLIHEGGHGVFKIFGDFIYTLGGTLMQIIIPTMFVVFYWKNSKIIPTQIFLVWLGQNLINISVYAADARAHKLPLLGGNNVYHDWTYLLNRTGLILYDQEVGYFFYYSALTVFLLALILPLLIRQYEEANIDLKL